MTRRVPPLGGVIIAAAVCVPVWATLALVVWMVTR